jgi:glutamate--cysteine ligase
MSVIKNKDQLIEYFNAGIKTKEQLKIGVEHEKFLFVGKDHKRINYSQLKRVFKNLEIFGWRPILEKKKYSWP